MSTRYASEKQVAFIRSLASKAGLASLELSAELTIVEASALIAELKNTIATSYVSRELPSVTDGIYRRSSDGAMFRVQKSQDSGRRYAKLLLPSGGWGYERGAIFTLRADERLTLAELEAWGLSTGVCALCGRLLSTAESVARGIGPVCASRY